MRKGALGLAIGLCANLCLGGPPADPLHTVTLVAFDGPRIAKLVETTEAKLLANGFQVRLIENQQGEGLETALSEVPDGSTVFFLSHGIESENQFYFQTHDAERKVTIAGRPVVDTVRQFLPNSPMWVVSCHSGCLGPQAGENLGTSASAKKPAYNDDQGSEFFLSAIIDAMTNPTLAARHDLDCNGVLEGEELKQLFLTRIGHRILLKHYRVSEASSGAGETGGSDPPLDDAFESLKKQHESLRGEIRDRTGRRTTVSESQLKKRISKLIEQYGELNVEVRGCESGSCRGNVEVVIHFRDTLAFPDGSKPSPFKGLFSEPEEPTGIWTHFKLAYPRATQSVGVCRLPWRERTGSEASGH
jgi:hypothetical protein